MGYGLIGIKQHMEGNSLNALRKVSQTQEQNKIRSDNIKAANKAQKKQTIGAASSVVGYMVGGPIGGAIGGLLGSIF